ncbi:unnamed protein product [Fraxinus pennsylvanica]|uniref:Uncharacterized protein n=1 Tax=Fraxinus pennsylvanica TaxID=56036 RepID=A0AAD1ZRG5_9LAMI|nr:unnamed protein product [Fraxinus pennsylvanica]
MKATEIVQTIGARKEGSDMIIWKSNDNEEFSTSSAWDLVRVRSPEIPWMKWIGHKSLPKKMVRSTGIALVSRCDCCDKEQVETLDHVLNSGDIAKTVWKWASLALGVHYLEAQSWWTRVNRWVRSTGIALVLRCDCCDKEQVETLDHVLNSGDIAKAVWKWASMALGVHYLEAQSWWTRVNRWFTCAKYVSQREILIGLLPSLITWKLWGRRCKARMEGNREYAEEPGRRKTAYFFIAMEEEMSNSIRRMSTRSRKVAPKMAAALASSDNRTQAMLARLEALENDNAGMEMVQNDEDDEASLDEDDQVYQKKQSKSTKRKTRQAKALEDAKKAPRTFLELLNEANLESLPPHVPSYFRAAVGPPSSVARRHFCTCLKVLPNSGRVSANKSSLNDDANAIQSW